MKTRDEIEEQIEWCRFSKNKPEYSGNITGRIVLEKINSEIEALLWVLEEVDKNNP